MSKMIQIRNVPDWLHRTLRKRAADRGQSLSAYLTEILENEATRPTIGEWLDGIKARGPIDIGDDTPAQVIRAERRDAGRED